MNIEYLEIRNYKSFDYSDNNKIYFNQGLNIFIGKNNSGKTTIVEALRLLNPDLLFEKIQIGWNANFPDIDPRIFVDQKNICKFSHVRPNFFEFEIKINNLIPFYKQQYSEVITNENTSYLKYSVRIYPFEQYFYFCLLDSLETDQIRVNVDLPTFDKYHTPLLEDELSKILVKKIIKKNGNQETLEYIKYLNLNGFGTDYPEIDLLKSFRFFYRESFYSPFQHIVQKHKKEYSDILPEYELLHELKELQEKVYQYEKVKNTQFHDYLCSRKLLDEFIKYSQLILGNLKFHFVSETYDYQEERTSRQAWPEDTSLSKLSEDEHHKKFQKYVAYFGNKFPFITEYSSLGDGIKAALNILFEALKFKYIKDEKDFNYNSLCLIIDEFDMNMHQNLSSTVFKSIIEISNVKSTNNQIILSSHSNSFIDQCENVDISINNICLSEKSLSSVQLITNKKDLITAFKEIGYKPSSFFISNGIIWVEGPSDIIYINFLIKIYSRFHGNDEFIRGKHFDFILYGGSNIKHHNLSDYFTDNFINILNINPNCFIVFDRDNYGTSKANSSENNKKKIIEALNNEDKYFMTQGSYIEYYLEQSDLQTFESKIKNKRSKVEYANKMISDHSNYDYWFNNSNDLKEQISKLVNNILSWND